MEVTWSNLPHSMQNHSQPPAQDHIQFLHISSDGDLSASLSTPCLCSVTLTAKKDFLHSEGTSCVSVCASCPQSCHWALLTRAWLPHRCAFSVYTHRWNSPQPSLLQDEKSQLSQPFLMVKSIIFLSLCWTLSSSSVSLLCWRAQNWTQHYRHDEYYKVNLYT